MTSVLPANIQSSTRLCRTWNEIKAIGFRYNIHCNTSQTAAGSSTRERPGQIDETFNPTYWQMNKVRIDYSTWLLVSPAVGLFSSDDSGTLASNCSSLSWQSPVHPTHRPWHLITTGATAVTKPPALYHQFPPKERKLFWKVESILCQTTKASGKEASFWPQKLTFNLR